MQTIKGADHELSFWKDFVKSDRFINGWLPDRKTPELNDLVYMFLLGQPDAKVLDCGSGVVSILHGTVKPGNLCSTDLLGNEYGEIFDYDKHGLTKPIPVGCEALTFDDVFDVVHISNAIDHTQDPHAAYLAMYRAVRPGGFLIVQGFTNEGTHEDWTGFHNWDIDLDESKPEHVNLSISDKRGWVAAIFNPYFSRKIYLEVLGRDWVIFITRKPLEA